MTEFLTKIYTSIATDTIIWLQSANQSNSNNIQELFDLANPILKINTQIVLFFIIASFTVIILKYKLSDENDIFKEKSKKNKQLRKYGLILFLLAVVVVLGPRIVSDIIIFIRNAFDESLLIDKLLISILPIESIAHAMMALITAVSVLSLKLAEYMENFMLLMLVHVIPYMVLYIMFFNDEKAKHLIKNITLVLIKYIVSTIFFVTQLRVLQTSGLPLQTQLLIFLLSIYMTHKLNHYLKIDYVRLVPWRKSAKAMNGLT